MNKNKLFTVATGSGLILLGIILRQLLEPHYWQVLQDVERGIMRQDTGPLILAGGLLAFLNTAGFLPVFLGVFKLGSLGIGRGKKRRQALFIVIAAVGAASLAIAWLEQDRLPLVVLFVVALLGYILLVEVAGGRLATVQEGIILVQLILAAQWLELIPFISFLGFGQSDLPASVRIAAQFLGSENVLNFAGGAFFVPLTLSAGVTTVLINSYSLRLAALNEAKSQQEELQQARLQAVKARVSQEMHSLVHDLKTPLMTIRGLNSILELGAGSDRERQYCLQIEGAVANMNEMISEILYDEVRSVISVDELVNYVRAHVMPESLPQQITIYLEPDLPPIKVNKIRLARALINVIENALKATAAKAKGEIRIRVEKSVPAGAEVEAGIEAARGEAASLVIFRVQDNGRGIPEEDMEKIWQVKFSTGDTPGLGLDFVKRVVENHQGTVIVSSSPGVGTEVAIYIPGGDDFEGAGNR